MWLKESGEIGKETDFTKEQREGLLDGEREGVDGGLLAQRNANRAGVELKILMSVFDIGGDMRVGMME